MGFTQGRLTVVLLCASSTIVVGVIVMHYCIIKRVQRVISVIEWFHLTDMPVF